MRIQYPHRTCVSFSLVKSKTSRKVKSEQSKTGDATLHFRCVRSRERRRATRVILNELCRKSAALPAVCARSSRAARAPHPPSPHTPHTATRPDRATRSPRPLDALTPRPLDCTRSQLLESDQMPQRHAWGVTTTVGDAPDPRCPAPHTPMAEMPTTYAHHTCTPHMRTKQALLAQGRETRRLLIGVLRREGPVPRVT